MKRFSLLWITLVVLAAPVGGCNDVGDCPSPDAITPGGACRGDNLECPFTLQTDPPACDGTSLEGGLATSCVCQNGTWSCPSPVSCGTSSTDDGGTTDGATTDGTPPDGGDGATIAADSPND
jgi:hypothetical protein